MQATTPLAAALPRQSESKRSHRQSAPGQRATPNPLGRLDHLVEATIGADMRLIYGMLVPMLMVFALIVPMVLAPSYWLVGLVLMFELCCLAFIVTKLLAMLDEPEGDGSTG